MDRLSTMSLLVAVADAQSFSAVARQRNIPLATLSRRLSDLETRLRTRLLDRTTRRVAPTDAGRAYIAACRRILEDVDEAERDAAGEFRAPTGHLRITAPIVFGRLHVLPVVSAFLDAYPDIAIQLELGDRLAHLPEEHIDVAIRIGPLPDSGLFATNVGSVRRVICGRPDHLARDPLDTPEALADRACIVFEGLSARMQWTFRTRTGDIDVPIRARLSVNTAEAAIDAATAGLGVTRVLSYQVARAVADGALALALTGMEPEPWPVNVVHAAQGLMPLKVRAFLDFAAPRLRARLAESARLLG